MADNGHRDRGDSTEVTRMSVYANGPDSEASTFVPPGGPLLTWALAPADQSKRMDRARSLKKGGDGGNRHPHPQSPAG